LLHPRGGKSRQTSSRARGLDVHPRASASSVRLPKGPAVRWRSSRSGSKRCAFIIVEASRSRPVAHPAWPGRQQTYRNRRAAGDARAEGLHLRSRGGSGLTEDHAVGGPGQEKRQAACHGRKPGWRVQPCPAGPLGAACGRRTRRTQPLDACPLIHACPFDPCLSFYPCLSCALVRSRGWRQST
jgi:hypothetical protein